MSGEELGEFGQKMNAHLEAFKQLSKEEQEKQLKEFEVSVEQQWDASVSAGDARAHKWRKEREIWGIMATHLAMIEAERK